MTRTMSVDDGERVLVWVGNSGSFGRRFICDVCVRSVRRVQRGDLPARHTERAIERLLARLRLRLVMVLQ